MVPRIVLGVLGDQPSLSQASENGVTIFEARIDQFDQVDPDFVLGEIKAIRRHGLPIIGTIRSRKEGGKAEVSDSKRMTLYERASPSVDAIDIELNSSEALKRAVKALTRKNKNTLIFSYHNFSKTPSEAELERILTGALSEGAEIVKIATVAENQADVIRLFQFTLKNRAKNIVTISMGETGSISRLVFPLAGSLMTYTSVAPSDGQIPVGELVQHIRLYYPSFNEELICRLKLLEFV